MQLLEGFVKSHLKLSHWKYWLAFFRLKRRRRSCSIFFFSSSLLLGEFLFVLTFLFNFTTSHFYVIQNCLATNNNTLEPLLTDTFIIYYYILVWRNLRVLQTIWIFNLPFSQHVPLYPGLQEQPWLVGVPEFWQLSVLHGRVSDKANEHDPPQDSATVLILFLVWVPLVPHWWEQWLQCDQ